DERLVRRGRDDEVVPQALRILEWDAAHPLPPELERLVGADAPDDRVDHPRARAAALRAGVLEERDVRAGTSGLVRVEQVVDGRVVLVDRLLDEAQAEAARVEGEVLRRVAGDVRD